MSSACHCNEETRNGTRAREGKNRGGAWAIDMATQRGVKDGATVVGASLRTSCLWPDESDLWLGWRLAPGYYWLSAAVAGIAYQSIGRGEDCALGFPHAS